MFALATTTLLGCCALAVDLGVWRYQQRLEQSAADSAAKAGAIEFQYSTQVSDVQAAAQKDAALNGFTNGAGSTIVVNTPPQSGNYAGDADAVEVIIQQPATLFFAAMFGNKYQTIARAVATAGQNFRNCIYTLDPGSNSFLYNGSTLTASQCGIISDGGYLGNGGTITAASIGVNGNILNNGMSYPLASPAPAAAANDPCPTIPGCAYLENNPPATSPCAYTNYSANGTTVTLNPGIYCGGTFELNGANATLNPGIYVFNVSNMIVNGSTVTGNGVTLYFPNGSADINGSTFSLTAPDVGETNDAAAGILYYQVPGDSSAVTFNGSSGSSAAGAFYAPSATNMILNGAITKWMLVVAYDLSINGSGTDIPDASSFPGLSQRVTLAE